MQKNRYNQRPKRKRQSRRAFKQTQGRTKAKHHAQESATAPCVRCQSRSSMQDSDLCTRCAIDER